MPSSDLVARLRTGSVRRILIPFAVLAAIVVPSFRVLGTAADLPTLDYNLCAMHELRRSEPAADVLVMGSSRTGAAIDIPLLESSFTGDVQTAEKQVLLYGSELDRDLAYRTYVASHGAPRVLVIELSFERYASRVAEASSLYQPTQRTKTLFDASVYADLIADLRDSDAASLRQTYVESTWMSTPSFWFERLNTGWELAIHNMVVAIDPVDTCDISAYNRGDRWVRGDSVPYDEATAHVPTDKSLRSWTRKSSRFRTFDPNDAYTTQELVLLDDLVARAQADGVEQVILNYLPSYAEKPASIDLDEISRRLPGTVVFDVREILADPARPKLKLQYRDVNHLNKTGAHVVTTELAALIEESLR